MDLGKFLPNQLHKLMFCLDKSIEKQVFLCYNIV